MDKTKRTYFDSSIISATAIIFLSCYCFSCISCFQSPDMRINNASNPEDTDVPSSDMHLTFDLAFQTSEPKSYINKTEKENSTSIKYYVFSQDVASFQIARHSNTPEPEVKNAAVEKNPLRVMKNLEVRNSEIAMNSELVTKYPEMKSLDIVRNVDGNLVVDNHNLVKDNEIPIQTVNPMNQDMLQVKSYFKKNKLSPNKTRKLRSTTRDLKGEKMNNQELLRLQSLPHNYSYSCSPSSSCNPSQFVKEMEGFIERPSCRCDPLCPMFNDCCHYVSIPHYSTSELTSYSIDSIQISCINLPNPDQIQPSFMVTNCPTNTQKELKEKCEKTVPSEFYSHVLDIPVVSKEPHVMYQNMFCAKCNNADVMPEMETSLQCQNAPYSWEHLKFMQYDVGQLQWQNESNICSLNIHFKAQYVRWCPQALVKTCSPTWLEDGNLTRAKMVEECSSGAYFVKARNKYYFNPSCAECNDINTEEIECPYQSTMLKSSVQPVRYPLTSPNCDSWQVWNEIYHTCESTFCEVDDDYCNSPNASSKISRHCNQIYLKRKFAVTFPNGSIFLRQNKWLFSVGEYEFIGKNSIAVCNPRGKWSKTMYNMSTILLSISLTCLALHMTIFLYLPKRRNIPSMNLFSLVLALFISELIFLCFFHYNKVTALCVAFATILYYFLTAAFLWMNVMSIDIWRTFRSSTYQTKSRKVFIQYSLYAWGIPCIPTVVVLLVDRLASKDLSIIPGFGSGQCWFNNMWGHAVFFTIPAGIIVLINMFFYGFSIWGIYRQHKLGELATKSIQQYNKQKPDARKNSDLSQIIQTKEFSHNNGVPRRCNSANGAAKNSSLKKRIASETENFFLEKIRKRIRANKKNRLRLALYSKLALIMGMTWVFCFMALHTNSIILEYLFIIFNGTQGTMIFLAFDCKTKIWNDLKERLRWRRTESFIIKDSCSKDYQPNGSYTQTERISFHYTSNSSTEVGPHRESKINNESVV